MKNIIHKWLLHFVKKNSKNIIPANQSKNLPQLELDGQILNYKQNTKFLGVYLPTKLNWRLHIKNLITKAATGQKTDNMFTAISQVIKLAVCVPVHANRSRHDISLRTA